MRKETRGGGEIEKIDTKKTILPQRRKKIERKASRYTEEIKLNFSEKLQ